MAKCKKCQNIYNLSNKDDVIVGKWCPKINDSPDIERERECKHFKSMSNADKIRAMTDEELADFFSERDKIPNRYKCKEIEDWIKWLQSEVE